MKNSYFNENTLEELLEEIKFVYQSDDRPWVIGYSGGKDSTVVVELVYKMLLDLPKKSRTKNVYIVSSDTMIENPIIRMYLTKMNKMLEEMAIKDDIPIKSSMVTPAPDNTFWANVIGKGFPTPRMNGTFRWCTDRLKIAPSGEYIQKIINAEAKEVIVVLGVRKEESVARKKRIEGREISNRLLNRHEVIKEAYVYNPIVELTTEDVWDLLMEEDNGITPWGADNSELVTMYGDANTEECPFAGITVDNGEVQTQSCGNSRFGCWMCTVVKEDKSLNGFIKSGKVWLIPLANLRKDIMDMRDLGQYREKKRRNGRVYETKNGEMGYGPFNWEGRIRILNMLLDAQKEMQEAGNLNYDLITEDELKAIDEIWDKELDLSRRVLVELYFAKTNKKLPWYDYKEELVDNETVEMLKESAKENDVPFELIRNLLLTSHKNKNYSNPKILRNSLDKLMKQQWLHYDVIKEIENENK